MRLPSSCIHVLILAALSLPYAINLGVSSIWDANEAFYAETPREMLVRGDFLAPYFNFQPRAQKPPLTYWAILASYKIFGINEYAVRLPSALAAVGVILFTYGISRMLYGPHAALIAAVIASTTPRIFILARRLPIDILLLFFLTGALFFLVRAILRRTTLNWSLAYLFAGLGFLVKGPIALVIPGGACLLWALWGRQLRWSEARIPAGVAIFLVVALPWYVLIFLRHGWTYIAPFFLKDNLGRFAAESMGPSRGPFYYLSVGAIDFFPWSILLLSAVWMLWRFRKAGRPLKNLAFGLPLIWCLLVFVLFSFSKNKQEYYIAPLYPAAAVIISGVLDKALKDIAANRRSAERARDSVVPDAATINNANLKSQDIWWKFTYGLLAVFLCLLSLLASYVFRSFLPNLPAVLHYAPSIILMAGTAVLVWSISRGKLNRCFQGIAVSLWAVYMAAVLVYLPALEQYRPVKPFCELIETQLGAKDETGSFRTALPSMAYYLRRPIFEEHNDVKMENMLQSRRRVFCIMTEKDYSHFADRNGLKIYILDRRSRFAIRLNALMNAGYSSDEELLLISNKPGAASKPVEDSSPL